MIQTIHALPTLDLDEVIETIAERVAEKIVARLPQHSPSADDPLLLSIEQAARKLGRTVPAMEHLIRQHRLPVVRIDRRIFLDYRDILKLIDDHKISARDGLENRVFPS